MIIVKSKSPPSSVTLTRPPLARCFKTRLAYFLARRLANLTNRDAGEETRTVRPSFRLEFPPSFQHSQQSLELQCKKEAQPQPWKTTHTSVWPIPIEPEELECCINSLSARRLVVPKPALICSNFPLWLNLNALVIEQGEAL